MNNYSQRVTASLETKKSSGHLLVLDGVRAVACLAVILHHIVYHIVLPEHWSGLWTPSGKAQEIFAALLSFGESGVILFFLLSSFLLFLPFAKALLFDGEWPSLSRFYIRRFFRILPGYYAAIILMVLFFHPELSYPENMWKLLQLFTFSMQFSVADQLNGPFWTMAIEFQFYLLLPLIAWVISLIVRRGTVRWRVTRLFICLLVMLGWGLLSRREGLIIQPSGTTFPQNILAFLQPVYSGEKGKFFESFAIGMLLAMLYVYTQNAPNGEILRRRLQGWSLWLFLIGLVTLGFVAVDDFFVIHPEFMTSFARIEHYRPLLTHIDIQWQTTAYSICYAFCLCALLYNAGRIRRPFEWPVLRWIGLFSFSLYMWHFPLLLLFLNMMREQPVGTPHKLELVALVAWVFFVIFPLSLTLYRWIEMPGIRLGEMLIQRVGRSKKVVAVSADSDTSAQGVASNSLVEVPS